MTERPRLAGMGPQFEAPSADDNHRRVHNVLRQTVREQGQVMSATLSNNALLWEERKQLRARIEQLESEVSDAARRLRVAETELAKLSTPEHRSLHELREQNEELARINDGLRKALQLHLVDAIDPAELKERLTKLTEQRAELEKSGAQSSELMREQDKRSVMARLRMGATEPVIEEEPPTLPG